VPAVAVIQEVHPVRLINRHKGYVAGYIISRVFMK